MPDQDVQLIKSTDDQEIIDLKESVGSSSGGTWTSWTPTLVGFSANPSNASYRYMLHGKTCHLSWNHDAGTSDATSFTISLPFTAATVTNHVWWGRLGFHEDNSVLEAGGACRIASGGTTVILQRALSDTGWTASGDKRGPGYIVYEIA